MADPRELTPGELVARGLMPPGPLAPALTSKNPEVNAQAIRTVINPPPRRFFPDPEMINPVRILGAGHHAAGVGLGKVIEMLGGLNLGGGMMSPEQKTLRSRQLGNQIRDMGEAALLPIASAGKVIGPLTQQARPLLTAFLTRLASQAGLSGLQKGMEGGGIGDVLKGAGVGAAFQGGMEGIAGTVRSILSSKAGARIFSEAAAKYKEALKSFEQRQQFDKELVSSFNELRSQGFKQEADRASAEYGQRAFQHKVEGQKLTADWERQTAAQSTLKEMADTTHMNSVAERIATDWDQRVPAWRGMPATVEGLIDRVYGQGQKKMSEAFDASVKEIITKAEGKFLKMPAAEADALGISTAGGALAGKPNALIGDGSDLAAVSAVDVAKALLGNKQKIDPDLYSSVANLLIQNGLGNAEANAAYSAGMALKKYIDKTHALEFIDQPKLYPERLLVGLTKESNLKELQRRIPEEDAIRGTIAAAREGLPSEMPEIPKPVQSPLAPKPTRGVEPPPMKTDPQLDPSQAPQMPGMDEMGLREVNRPTPWKAHVAGSMLGSAGGMLAGAPGGHYGVGGLLGGALGMLLPALMAPQTLKGPVSAGAEKALSAAPTAAAGILRALFTGGEVSPADLEEIRAAQSAGKTALDNPNLSLQIDPSETR